MYSSVCVYVFVCECVGVCRSPIYTVIWPAEWCTIILARSLALSNSDLHKKIHTYIYVLTHSLIHAHIHNMHTQYMV